MKGVLSLPSSVVICSLSSGADCLSVSPARVFLSLTSFTMAYVTYEDLRHINSLRDQTVIVVKAPPDTKLEVPDPEQVSHTREQRDGCCPGTGGGRESSAFQSLPKPPYPTRCPLGRGRVGSVQYNEFIVLGSGCESDSSP